MKERKMTVRVMTNDVLSSRFQCDCLKDCEMNISSLGSVQKSLHQSTLQL